LPPPLPCSRLERRLAPKQRRRRMPERAKPSDGARCPASADTETRSLYFRQKTPERCAQGVIAGHAQQELRQMRGQREMRREGELERHRARPPGSSTPKPQGGRGAPRRLLGAAGITGVEPMQALERAEWGRWGAVGFGVATAARTARDEASRKVRRSLGFGYATRHAKQSREAGPVAQALIRQETSVKAAVKRGAQDRRPSPPARDRAATHGEASESPPFELLDLAIEPDAAMRGVSGAKASDDRADASHELRGRAMPASANARSDRDPPPARSKPTYRCTAEASRQASRLRQAARRPGDQSGVLSTDRVRRDA